MNQQTVDSYQYGGQWQHIFIEKLFPPINLVDHVGIEPTDNCVQSNQEPQLNHSPNFGALYRNRTYSPEGTVLQTAMPLQLHRQRIVSILMNAYNKTYY